MKAVAPDAVQLTPFIRELRMCGRLGKRFIKFRFKKRNHLDLWKLSLETAHRSDYRGRLCSGARKENSSMAARTVSVHDGGAPVSGPGTGMV